MAHGALDQNYEESLTYAEEYNLFVDRLKSAISRSESVEITTDRVVAASAFSEEFSSLYEENSVSLVSFLRFLLRLYKEYEPGKPLSVPIVDGTPYGLSVEIEVPPSFDITSFDELVHRNWDSLETYSWTETLKESKGAINTQGIVRGLISAGKGFSLLASMKVYAAMFLPSLKGSYSVSDGEVGIRFICGKEANYINISGGTKSYEDALEAAKTVACYLDQTNETTAD